MEYLRRGDTLVVWKLDRLGRLVKEVLTIAAELDELGIGVRILTGTLAGTYRPTGKASSSPPGSRNPPTLHHDWRRSPSWNAT